MFYLLLFYACAFGYAQYRMQTEMKRLAKMERRIDRRGADMLRLWIITALQCLSLHVDREAMAGLLFLWWLAEMVLMVRKEMKEWADYWGL